MSLTPPLEEGLSLLFDAYKLTNQTNSQSADFALELDTLLISGMSKHQLRSFLILGYVKHYEEVFDETSPDRMLAFQKGLNLGPSSCFVLTSLGVEFYRGMIFNLEDQSANQVNRLTHVSQPIVKPCWDTKRRQLSFNGIVIKEFQVPARNQVTILAAFEEEGWPSKIDDPLYYTANVDPNTRLHDAINRLNGKQINPLIRFHGDGTGKGVKWTVAEPKVD